MAPITWNANDKSILLNVVSSGLRVDYTGCGENNEDAVIRTTNPIPLQFQLFYFEIDVENNEKNGIIAIGFCTKSAELNKIPGCSKDSCGHHSDDGNFFICSDIDEPYGSGFETKDTIGCLLNFRNNTVLYTKNGMNLGIAFRNLNEIYEKKGSKVDLYPCIGIRSKGGSISIKANFGEEEFKYTSITDYDIDDDRVKKEWTKAFKKCDNKDIIEDFIKLLNSLEISQKNMLRYSAKANFIMGEYKKALTNLNDLLEIEKNDAFALRYREETYLILNEYEKSKADLTTLLKINKDDEWATKAIEAIERRVKKIALNIAFIISARNISSQHVFV